MILSLEFLHCSILTIKQLMPTLISDLDVTMIPQIHAESCDLKIMLHLC